MPRHLEIERKFLVERLPTGWRDHPCSQILQGYIPMAGKDLEVRLRRKGAKYFMTVKLGHGQCRLEDEIRIPEAEFRALWPLTGAARVSKQRYKIPCDGRTIEMDVYDGAHRGLVTAEVEFASLDESRGFQPPAWLGREVTGRRKYSNEQLARHGSLPQQQARS